MFLMQIWICSFLFEDVTQVQRKEESPERWRGPAQPHPVGITRAARGGHAVVMVLHVVMAPAVPDLRHLQPQPCFRWMQAPPVETCVLGISVFLPSGFSVGTSGKESAYQYRDWGLIPGLGRYPGGGRGNPLQYFCLEYIMDRGAWWAKVHGVAESDRSEAT